MQVAACGTPTWIPRSVLYTDRGARPRGARSTDAGTPTVPLLHGRLHSAAAIMFIWLATMYLSFQAQFLKAVMKHDAKVHTHPCLEPARAPIQFTCYSYS